jgi:hypothetical protein
MLAAEITVESRNSAQARFFQLALLGTTAPAVEDNAKRDRVWYCLSDSE